MNQIHGQTPESSIDREVNPFGWPHPTAELGEDIQVASALGDSVAGSLIPHIHPEGDNKRYELEAAVLNLFPGDDPDNSSCDPVLRVLKDLGFEINSQAIESGDFANNPLLVLPEEKVDAFREHFPRNFRFTEGHYLVGYFFVLDRELDRDRRYEDIIDYFGWKRELEAAVSARQGKH